MTTDARQQFEKWAKGNETGWLIEKGGLCLGTCEYRFRWVTFTDPNALRFARRVDAYAFKESIKWPPYNMKELNGAEVTEHMWAVSPRGEP